VQAPQFTERLVPQLSYALSTSQSFASRVHSAMAVSGVHPQLLGAVPPPQVEGARQVPQLRVRCTPQLSSSVCAPHVAPTPAQKVTSLSGMHPHTFSTPPAPQLSRPLHCPHAAVRGLPQLSLPENWPQLLPCAAQKAASVCGTQPEHTLATPSAPQRAPPAHVPQFTVRLVPQLSTPVTTSQFFPNLTQNCASLSAPQLHTFGVPPPPQVRAPLQMTGPQVALRALPHRSVPENDPQSFPAAVQNSTSVSGVHPPQTFGVPPAPHSMFPEQAPQSTVRSALQLSMSDSLPQSFSRRTHSTASLSARQGPQRPALQVLGAVQKPQSTSRTEPQLSGCVTVPQLLPLRRQYSLSVSARQVPAAAQAPLTHARPPQSAAAVQRLANGPQPVRGTAHSKKNNTHPTRFSDMVILCGRARAPCVTPTHHAGTKCIKNLPVARIHLTAV
jgi:hypothetical protein